MHLVFDLGPLRVTAEHRPAVAGRRSGHPDLWTEDEPEEIEVLSVEGEANGEHADRDIEDAVRDEARRFLDDQHDAWIERKELTR